MKTVRVTSYETTDGNRYTTTAEALKHEKCLRLAQFLFEVRLDNRSTASLCEELESRDLLQDLERCGLILALRPEPRKERA
jgi:hypothetical protein